MQTRAQNEVAVQQRPGFPEKRQQIFAHLGSARRWRAVFGGPPKTNSYVAKHANSCEKKIVRRVK
jgi:hypothetical protein